MMSCGDHIPGLSCPHHISSSTGLIVQISAPKSCHHVHSSLSAPSQVISQGGTACKQTSVPPAYKLERMVQVKWKRGFVCTQTEENLFELCAYASELNWLLLMRWLNTTVPGCCFNLCCCSVTQSCLTLCGPMDGSAPGFPVLHYFPVLAQTHVH